MITTPSVHIPDPLPLVGRAGELDGLKELLGAQDRRTSVVVLSGEGGVGKTRLAAELAQEAEKKGWTVARGRAYPVETGVPYALFADAFLPIMREMDAARLTVLSRGGEAELRRLFPALGGGDGFVDTSGDPDEFRTRLMWNFTEFLKSYAKKAPLLCVLEDLQWADGSSLELLHFIARQVTGHPVVILCSCNDAEQERGSQLVQVERSLVSLGVGEIRRLSALTREEVTELLTATFDVDASVVREFSAMLYGWTRGNVFFVEEILKSMLASGGITRQNGVWVGWDATDFALPGSIRDAVLGRMGSLSIEAQGVAELAAVIGARSRYRLLAALSGLDEPALLVALEELCHHRVLDERMEDGGVVYVFSHPMVRQTLYGELGLQRARSLHGKVAEAMEALHGERALDHADELAYHFSRTDAAHLRRKATGYLAEAGRRALERRAGPEAVDYLQAALDSARSESDADAASTARLVALLARARQHVGDFEGAIGLWREAVAHVPRDAPEYPAVCRALGMAHFWCGHHDEAHRRLDEGLEAADALGDRAAVVRLRVAKGHCLHEVGRGADALETVLPALPIAARLKDVGTEARVHRALALLYLWIGPPDKARHHGHRAIELAREAGDVSIEFWARWGLAVLGGMRGETGDMRDAIKEIKDLAARSRSPVLSLWTAEMEIELAYGQGDWDSGIALGEQAIVLARDLHQRTLLPRLLVWTSHFYQGRGQLDRARELVDEAVALSGLDDDSGPVDVHQFVPASIGLAHYLVGVGDYAAAIEAAEKGLRVAEGTGYTLWAVHRLLPVMAEACLWAGEIDRAGEVGAQLRAHAETLDHKLGTAWADACDALVCWKLGDPGGAVDLMRQAAQSLDEIPMLPYAARVRRQLAGRLLDVGENEAAVAELRQVHDACVRLGAEPELEKTRLMFREAGHTAPPRGMGEGVAGLTERETEVAILTARRLTNEEIGEQLRISPRTASTHLSKIYKKLGIGSRGELADVVREAGLLNA